jgi:dipeptidase E
VKNDILDGLRLFEDITYADSMGHTFYVLPDFSYIVSDAEGDVLFGAGYRLHNGILELLTRDGEILDLNM